jgi:hypothetical protein
VAYPTDLDDFTTVENGNTITAAMFNTPNLATEFLQVEVGIDGTSAESLRYKCDNFFVAATHVFFAQATPPTGWTTDTAHKDNVLACKSDAGTYSTIGADKGNWTYAGFTADAHAHQWHATNQSWQSNGSSTIALYHNYTSAVGLIVHVAGATGYRTANNLYTKNSSASGVTHDGADRPLATVGVIATYTGAV